MVKNCHAHDERAPLSSSSVLIVLRDEYGPTKSIGYLEGLMYKKGHVSNGKKEHRGGKVEKKLKAVRPPCARR